MKSHTRNKNTLLRTRRRARVRARVQGTAARPRLAVYRSNRFISAQLINDTVGKTLAAAHGREHAGAAHGRTAGQVQAKAVGETIAQRAKAQGITAVVFDRGGYRYGGQVKTLADAAREGGLTF